MIDKIMPLPSFSSSAESFSYSGNKRTFVRKLRMVYSMKVLASKQFYLPFAFFNASLSEAVIGGASMLPSIDPSKSILS